MSPPYEGPERRQDTLTEDRVKLMIQEAVQTALTAHEQHLMAHMDKQFAALRASFAEGFPGGDPHGHRVAHERLIANASWWDKTKSDAASKVAAGGFWMVMGFIAFAVWEHFKSELRK
jgi:hypothetical protein